jgi:hypothetical protein
LQTDYSGIEVFQHLHDAPVITPTVRADSLMDVVGSRRKNQRFLSNGGIRFPQKSLSENLVENIFAISRAPIQCAIGAARSGISSANLGR